MPCSAQKPREVGHARHRAVGVHDLADHARGRAAGEAGEVDGGLGLARALQHAARARAQREDVAGLDEVARPHGGIDGDLDRVRAVGGRDAGRDALARLDRDREGRLVRRLVVRDHHAQPELVAALRRERQADQPAAVRGHEVDGLGRDVLGGHAEVALVLAVRGVDDDDHASRPGSSSMASSMRQNGEAERVVSVPRLTGDRSCGHCAQTAMGSAGARRTSPAGPPRG